MILRRWESTSRSAHRTRRAWPTNAGELLWSGHRFRTNAADLEALVATTARPTATEAVTVVMEPTRNAWVPLAAWFRRRGATSCWSRRASADLRAYYAKHTKSDRLDSVLLARLPLLHPEGLHPEQGLGPVTRCAGRRSCTPTLVKRRTTSLARLDALLEILGPDWHAAFGSRPGPQDALRFLAAGTPTRTPLRRSAGPGWPGSCTDTPAAPRATPHGRPAPGRRRRPPLELWDERPRLRGPRRRHRRRGPPCPGPTERDRTSSTSGSPILVRDRRPPRHHRLGPRRRHRSPPR